MTISPIDAVLAIIQSLNEKERELVRIALGTRSPCGEKGHKIKAVKKEPEKFWLAPKTILYCERCNYREEV